MTTNDVKTDQDKFRVKQTKGAFDRPSTKFHNKISTDPNSKFPAEPNRYHLYVSLACPWAHRTLITRALKGLEDVISYSVVDPYLVWKNDYKDVDKKDEKSGYIGWEFTEKYPDPLHDNTKSVWDLYKMTDPNYPNKYLSVPILWDKKTNVIVNNESAQIIVMLNTEFNKWAKNKTCDLNPEKLQKAMEEVNSWIYPTINDGVYRCGFATTQEAYEEAFVALFESLDKMEKILSKQRYLCSNDTLTLSDIRAVTTLLRFDSVYYVHFKCNKKRIQDYPNIWGYVREICQIESVKKTIDIEHIKYHYYYSHAKINPYRIVPKGPVINWDEPHGRDKKY